MLRREIMLKVKKGFAAEEVDGRLAQARAAALQIPYVLTATVSRNADSAYRVAVLTLTVGDWEALIRLQIHHLHATIVGLLQGMAEDIVIRDASVNRGDQTDHDRALGADR